MSENSYDKVQKYPQNEVVDTEKISPYKAHEIKFRQFEEKMGLRAPQSDGNAEDARNVDTELKLTQPISSSSDEIDIIEPLKYAKAKYEDNDELVLGHQNDSHGQTYQTGLISDYKNCSLGSLQTNKTTSADAVNSKRYPNNKQVQPLNTIVKPLQVRKLAPFDLSRCLDHYSSDVKAGPFFEDCFEDYDVTKLEEFLDNMILEDFLKQQSSSSLESSDDVKKSRKRLFRKSKSKSNLVENAGVPDVLTDNGPTVLGGPYTIDQGKATTPAFFSDDSNLEGSAELESLQNLGRHSMDFDLKGVPNVLNKTEQEEEGKKHHRFGFKSRKQKEPASKPVKEIHTTLALETVLSKVNKNNMLGSAEAVSPLLDFRFPTSYVGSASSFGLPGNDPRSDMAFPGNLHDSKFGPDGGVEPSSVFGNPGSASILPSAVALSTSLDPKSSSGFESVYCLDYISPDMEKVAEKAMFSPALFGPKEEESKWLKKEYQTRKATFTGNLGVKVTTGQNPSRANYFSSVNKLNHSTPHLDRMGESVSMKPNNSYATFGLENAKYQKGRQHSISESHVDDEQTFVNTDRGIDQARYNLLRKKNKNSIDGLGLGGLRGMGSIDGLTGLGDKPGYGEYYSNYGEVGSGNNRLSDIELTSSKSSLSKNELESADKHDPNKLFEVAGNWLNKTNSVSIKPKLKTRKSISSLMFQSLNKKKTTENLRSMNDTCELFEANTQFGSQNEDGTKKRGQKENQTHWYSRRRRDKSQSKDQKEASSASKTGLKQNKHYHHAEDDDDKTKIRSGIELPNSLYNGWNAQDSRMDTAYSQNVNSFQSHVGSFESTLSSGVVEEFEVDANGGVSQETQNTLSKSFSFQKSNRNFDKNASQFPPTNFCDSSSYEGMMNFGFGLPELRLDKLNSHECIKIANKSQQSVANESSRAGSRNLFKKLFKKN